MSGEQILPKDNNKTYVVVRTSRISLKESDLLIEVAFTNINDASDMFVLDVSIIRAMQYRPSTLWQNGKMIGIISSSQLEKLTDGEFNLIQSSYHIDPKTLNDWESFKHNIPTIMLQNNQIKLQSMELVFATYGAHELIQDLIRFSPDEVLKKHSKEGYDSLDFNHSPYEIYLKNKAWNNNVFAYTLLANIRHNSLVHGSVATLNKQFNFFRDRTDEKFLIQGVPWHCKQFTVSGNVMKNIQTGAEYLWGITGASLDDTIPVKQFVDHSSSDSSDVGIKSGSSRIRYFESVEPEIVDETPGRNDGEYVTPFKTTLIGSAPIRMISSVPKDSNSSGGGSIKIDAERVSKGSGNDPHGMNKGVAIINTGASQNDFFSDNMRLLVVASRSLVKSVFTSIEWVASLDCLVYPEPVCLYFKKTEHNKDWVVVAKRENEEARRFVLLFKFNIKDKQPVYMLELDSDQACCVLFFKLHRKENPYLLRRVMRIIATKKGVMSHVVNDRKLAKLGKFVSKKHWKMLDETADTNDWIEHVAAWIRERIDF